MCSVSIVIHRVTVVIDKVPSHAVVQVSVSVIIDGIGATRLSKVSPYVPDKVIMAVINSRIENGNQLYRRCRW